MYDMVRTVTYRLWIFVSLFLFLFIPVHKDTVFFLIEPLLVCLKNIDCRPDFSEHLTKS
jgi:hypothetical protein